MLTAKGHIEISDTEYSIRTANAIIDNRSLLIDPPDKDAALNFPSIREEDKIYSPYGFGLSLIFIPYILAGKMFSSILSIEQRIVTDFLLSFYNLPFAILGLYYFKRILISLGSKESKAILVTIILGLGTSFWKYTVTDFSEITQACCLLAIVFYIINKSEKKWLHISFWYSALILIKLTYLIFFIPLFTLFIIENQKEKYTHFTKKFLHSSAYTLPCCCFIGLLNYLRFNDVFESGYGSTINFSYEFFKRDWLGYLISSDRGILNFNPICLISFFGIFFIPQKAKFNCFIIFFIVLIWYLTMCFWSSWQGGYCWGNRLLIPILPLLIIPIVFFPLKKLLNKILLFSLVMLSMIIQFAGSFTKIHEIIEIKLKIQDVTSESPNYQLSRGIKLFCKKINSTKPMYNLSDFGIKNNSQIIDLTGYKTFYGFNLWSVHLFNHLGFKSYWIGIIVLGICVLICVSICSILSINFKL
jgi:hypothetical protein